MFQRRRTINAFIIAAVLTFGATAFLSAGTTGRDGDDAANIVADNGANVGTGEDTAEAPKKKRAAASFML